MDRGSYNFRAEPRFSNTPIDRRRLNKQDRRDLNQSGEYGSQVAAYKRAKAYNARKRQMLNRDIKTTTRTPGSGGQTIGYRGTGIQQERYRNIGEENRKAKSMRPDLDSTLYDIYKAD